MLKPKPAIFSKNFYFIFIALLAFGCASIQKPMGGPRDLTPPKLLKATPENMTRNFKAKEIRLEFDEFYKLNNQYQEITISPAMEKQPEYKISKRDLIIDFKDSLQKNTTYVINFGKAIQDVNEGNVMDNFTYVFSTGPHIDSLSMSGFVMNSITQEKEKDATVMIFTVKQDSLLFGKKKPTIFATTDSAGNFSLNNLHDGEYKIYALKEPSPNKIFDNDKELIAFSNRTINLNKDTSGIRLSLFQQIPQKFRVSEKKLTNDGVLSLVFNKRLTNPSLKIIYPQGLDEQKIVDISKTKDTALVYMRNMAFDSLRVAIYDNNKPIDTIYQLKGRKEAFTRVLTFKYGINRDNKLKPNTDLRITANLPVENIEPGLISITIDSANVPNLNVQKDPENPRVIIVKNRWRAGGKYQLVLNEAAVVDIYGDKNKRTGINFEADKPDNYSQLTLKVTVPDSSKSYAIELLDEQKNLIHSDPISKSGSIVYKNYLTGKYKIRVVYDTNKNGRWDSGNVKLKAQPENIWLYNKEITLRANWEAEEPLDIPKEQVNP
ncbi:MULTISPECIES: Ig-like domain-containing protein [unclassified Mucilaginibacter]|uniref:Ig-like domain-containing protein n=1 Tax=unclassified Mucilaginibacter TaxID=2617802 RepID=UPI002B22E0CA|nr:MULTISPECIES: Ig-like domain-containing protein [unclassified Mucilaginibacter]MEB0261681.1 Ig-like domain-containing protein [Mucilaginibacter sp. 10I4]MEB0278331.1 Ig-like domain-containing protein [Mucilaginibacter sp. 10B2]